LRTMFVRPEAPTLGNLTRRCKSAGPCTSGDGMKKRFVTTAFVVALAISIASAAPGDRARYLEGASAAKLSPAELTEEPKGYLPTGALDGATIVPPPPVADSAEDKADVAQFKRTYDAASQARWQRALDDDKSLYDRFDKDFGLPLDRRHLPRLIRLLNRVEADVAAITGDAKKHFARPRPFQRFALKRVCGEATSPKPDPKPAKATSYPSGHASNAWAAVLVLDEIAPERAQPLLMRAADYGESRVVCGAHFPADIEAGRTLAGKLVDKLLTVPEFRRDMVCAKTEYRAVLAGEKSEDLAACY
jgi:acid phosphatase (class A)